MIDRYAELHAAHRWAVPESFNIALACCTRWASDRARFALYWEDEGGARGAYTFWDLQREANRLANALQSRGVRRGDKVAIILPQRPETVIAHIATYQLGAIAVPLSFLFGPEALQYRLENAECRVAFVDPQSLPNIVPIRAALTGLTEVIGVAGARAPFTVDWDDFVRDGSTRFDAVTTAACDPALIIYTSGTTGPPKGAVMPHQCLLGNLPGFTHSHDGYPRAGDLFWSPADWAWTGGLMDALLPALYHGQPIVGYRGRFDPERALELIARYQVRNAFLFPTALKLIMKAFPRPRERFDVNLRSIMSAGEAVGTAVFEWARSALGVTINEMFGQTEMNYIVGNSHELWPVKAGSMGRPYPGHRITWLDEAGAEVADGQVGEVAVHRVAPDGTPDPVFFLEYFRNPEGTARKYTGDWCRTGDLATRDADGYLWYQGRADDVFKAAGYRIGPSEIENCLVKHPAVINAAVVPKPDAERGALVKAYVVLAPMVLEARAITTRGQRDFDAELVAELQLHVKGKLAPYEYPKEIEFIKALPMTTTGKVQRRVLRLQEEERARSRLSS